MQSDYDDDDNNYDAKTLECTDLTGPKQIYSAQVIQSQDPGKNQEKH